MLHEKSICYTCQRTDWNSAYSPCPIITRLNNLIEDMGLEKIAEEYGIDLSIKILIPSCRSKDEILGNPRYVPRQK